MKKLCSLVIKAETYKLTVSTFLFRIRITKIVFLGALLDEFPLRQVRYQWFPSGYIEWILLVQYFSSPNQSRSDIYMSKFRK